MSKQNRPLSNFRPQQVNSNQHTERGLGMLERSIGKDGFIGAMTATADGEMFDGSARLEKVVEVLPVDPIIIESDGTRPIIHIRTDIPNANDPRAKRLSVAANRIAQVDLAFDANILADFSADGLLDGLFTSDELKSIGVEVPDFLPVGEDEQGRLDQKAQVECPNCGHKFTP